MSKKAVVRRGKNYAPQRVIKTFGRQEGWNSGIRNFGAQKDIDDKRKARAKKFRRKGSNRKWGDYVKYRGIY